MKILPAIDIKNSKCVRLQQGDFGRETIYEDDPVVMAMKWKLQGATELHIVDLDGAKEGTIKNMSIIKKIIENTNLMVQVGGGIRTLESARQLFEIGVSRIILGTVVVENRELLKEFIIEYGSKIIVSLDVKNNKLAKKGWIETSNNELIPTAIEMGKIGVETIIYTDTNRDGMLTEPNYSIITDLKKAININLLIAGGVSSCIQIKKLKQIGLDGVIIGKALYEEKINLKEVIDLC